MRRPPEGSQGGSNVKEHSTCEMTSASSYVGGGVSIRDPADDDTS